MAIVPTVRTWSVGEVVTALTLNGIRDGLRFLLSGRPKLVLRQTTQQVVPMTGGSALAFQFEGIDSDGMFDGATDATKVTVQTAGWYRALALLTVDASNCSINTAPATAAQVKGGLLSANPNQAWSVNVTVQVTSGGINDIVLWGSGGAGWGNYSAKAQAAGLVYLNAGDVIQVFATHDPGLFEDGTLKTSAYATGNDGSVSRLELEWVSS